MPAPPPESSETSSPSARLRSPLHWSPLPFSPQENFLESGCKACGGPEERRDRVEVIVTSEATSCSCPAGGALLSSPKMKKGAWSWLEGWAGACVDGRVRLRGQAADLSVLFVCSYVGQWILSPADSGVLLCFSKMHLCSEVADLFTHTPLAHQRVYLWCFSPPSPKPLGHLKLGFVPNKPTL